jgi:hypothetical protein
VVWCGVVWCGVVWCGVVCLPFYNHHINTHRRGAIYRAHDPQRNLVGANNYSPNPTTNKRGTVGARHALPLHNMHIIR